MGIQTTRTKETRGSILKSTPSVASRKAMIYWRKFLRCPGLGIILALLSGFCYVTFNICVKLLPCMNPLQLFFYSSLFETAVFSVIIIQTSGPVLGDITELKYIILHVVCGFIATNSNYYAIRLVPLLDCLTIVFSAPVVVVILERFFLKRRIERSIGLSLVITLTGVCLITKPFTIFINNDDSQRSTDHVVGYTLSLVACSTLAVYYVSVEKIKFTKSSVLSIGLTLITVFVNPVILTITKDWCLHDCGKDGWVIVMSSVLATLNQFLVIVALKIQKAGPVSIARNVDIVIAFIYQSFLFKEEVKWTSVLGSVLVCTSVGIISWKKWRTDAFFSEELQMMNDDRSVDYLLD